jgi:hypothetical protein
MKMSSSQRPYLTLLFLLLFFSLFSYSQDSTIHKTKHTKAYDSLFYPFKNCAYLEFFGNSETLLSLNYERILNGNSRAKLHYSLRAGFAYTKRTKDTAHMFSFPFELIFMYGRRKHYIESGIGYTAVFGKHFIDSTRSPPVQFEKYNRIYVFRLGYRYMYNGFLLRVTPLYIYKADFLNKLYFRGCISVGLAF